MTDTATLKPCRYCAKGIPASANLCSGCNRFQNWRRFFSTTSTVLSLMVAFISVAVVGLPQLIEALSPERGRLTVTFRSNSGNRVSMIVYNTGNVAAALEGFAELHVPTEYLPIEDPAVEGLIKQQLPYNRLDLILALSGSDDALIEAGASRHFELQAQTIEPWRWRLDLAVNIEHQIQIDGDDDGELQSWLDKFDLPLETTSNSVWELLVTPLESRIWLDSDNDAFCRLQLGSIDVAGARQRHDLPVNCRRVADLIELLPSRVRIESRHVSGAAAEAYPIRSFEHQLVVNGERRDTSNVKINIINSSEINRDELSDEDLEDLFKDPEDLFEDDDLF